MFRMSRAKCGRAAQFRCFFLADLPPGSGGGAGVRVQAQHISRHLPPSTLDSAETPFSPYTPGPPCFNALYQSLSHP